MARYARRNRRVWILVWSLFLLGSVLARAQAAPALGCDRTLARHVVARLTFGARPGDVERMCAQGIDAWIAAQLRPGRIDDRAFETAYPADPVLALPTSDLLQRYPVPGVVLRGLDRDPADAGDPEAQRRELAALYRERGYGRPQALYAALGRDRLLRAAYSERQLQEVMVDFWSNHFNVYARKGPLATYLPAFDREVIRPHALGRFEDLLLASARSPAMLFYLDNAASVSAEGAADAARRRGQRLARLDDDRLRAMLARRRGLDAQAADDAVRRLREGATMLAQNAPSELNENYARELLELHTLGVDGGYEQHDVREVARAFTGWSIADVRGYRALSGGDGVRPGRGAPGPAGHFVFNAALHDGGAKTVLGTRIDAGGVRDGEAVIALLARHPSTARAIARKLAVKFVADAPPEALVDRVASAFTRSGGDIRATLEALFADPGFRDPARHRAKVRTPLEFVVAGVRALEARTDGRVLLGWLADLGEPLYGQAAPTGWPDTAADWVSSGALLKRMNFATALAGNRIPGTAVDLDRLAGADDPGALLEAGIERWLGDATPQTRAAVRAQLAQPLTEAQAPAGAALADDAVDAGMPRLRLRPASGDPGRIRLAALLLGSPDFQRQ